MTADEFLTGPAPAPSADEFLSGGMSADEFLGQEDPPTIGPPREVGFFRGIYDAARNTRVADTILGPPEYRRPPLGDRIQQEGLIGAAMAPFAGAIPRLGRQEGLAGQVGAGTVNALSALTEGLVSPLAATSLLPSTLGRVASAGFAVDMGRHVPGQVQSSVDAFRSGDVQAGVESGLGAVGSLGFAGLAAKHAVTRPGERPAPQEMAVSLSEALRQSVEQSSLPPGLATDALVMRTPGEPVLRPEALEGPTNLEVELQRGPIPDDPPVRVAESDVVSPPVRPPEPDTPRQMPGIDAELPASTLDSVASTRTTETKSDSGIGVSPQLRAESEVSGTPRWNLQTDRSYSEQWEATLANVGGIPVEFGRNGDRVRITPERPNVRNKFNRALDFIVDFDSNGDVVFSKGEIPEGSKESVLAEGKRLALLRAPLEGDVYLRYGPIPKSGFSRNHVTGQNESGVSVYRAIWNPALESYVLADAQHAATALDLIAQGKKATFVTGNEIGRGSDGEPVLSETRIVAKASQSGYGYLPATKAKRNVGSSIDAEVPRNTLGPVTGQRTAETITGSKEGIASEMPAEREERPQPAAGDPVNPAPSETPSRVVRVQDPNAPTNLTEFLRGGRIINLSGIRAAAPDWTPPAGLRKNFRANSGTSWDVVAREMFETGLLKTEPKDGGEFAEAITRANENAKSYRRENALQRRTVDVEAKQLSQFETKVLDGKVSKAAGPVEPLALADIYKGDTFQADGHKFEVKETRTDEDGNLLSVRLKDGPKFGEQVVDAERGKIFVEPGSLKQKPRADDFLAAEDVANDPFADRVNPPETPESSTPQDIFGAPESVEQQAARLAQEAAAKQQRAQREELAAGAARKLTGKAIDTTGDLLDPLAADNPLFAVPMGRPGGGRGGSRASIGDYAEGGPVTLGHLETIRPVQAPELVRLAQGLGSDVLARKMKVTLRGQFVPMGNGTIKLNRQLFELGYEQQLAKTLAHEIGHLADWLPDKAMDRGNILGRIATLRNFLRQSMPKNPLQSFDTLLTTADRAKLRRQAEQKVGQKPAKTDEAARAAWSAEVSRVYQEQVRAEMAARGLVKAGDVHAELWELSQDWRPLGDVVTDSHLRYRMGSDELYADAISVLLNNPGMLEKQAPNFYKLFFDYLDQKPAVKEAYFSLQELLSQGPLAVAQRRRSQTVEGFVKGEEILREKLRQDRDAESQPHGWWARVQQEWVDRGSYLKQQVERIKAKGAKISPDVDPTIALEEMGWVESEHAVTAQDVHQRVVGPVIASGLDTHALGELLKYERIAGGLAARQRLRDRLGELGREEYDAYRGYARNVTLDRETAEAGGIDYDLVEAMRTDLAEQGTRADIPNPAAESPDSVQASLDSLRRSMTEQQWQTLRKAGAEFRKIVYEKMKRATEEGIISRSTFDHTITDNKDWYATFRGLDHIEDTVSPFIRQAKGSLSDIENPFYSTVLKLFSVNNVMLRNRAKRLTRDQFIQHFPDEFRPAESYHNGKQRMLRNPKDGLVRLELMEDGKKLSYDVDPYIGAAFEKMTPADVGIFTKTLNAMFGSIYPLIIKYNPQFQLLTNPVRDFSRTVRSYRAIAGEGGMVSMARRYADAIKNAKNFVSGDLSDPVVRAMMEAKAIGTPMEGFGQNAGETAGWGDILERYRILRPTEKTQLRRAAGYLPHAIQRAGAVLEALPKVAAFKALTIEKGLSDREAAATVRRYIGTPDFKIKGTHGAVHNSLVPFLNIFLQGYRADLRLATQPKTRGGWWMRYMLQDGSVAMLTGLAVAGLFGTVVQQAFEGISEHDRSNYIVIPVGYEAAGEHGRKVVYLRLPRDEASRVVSAATYKLSKLAADAAAGNPVSPGRVASDVFGAVEAVIPSVNPMLDIAGAWRDYLRNTPPIDAWRNRPIIPDREWNAGGWAAVKPLLKWTVGKTGIFNIFAYDTEAETTTEMAVSGVPVLKTLLKISDYGYTEKQSQTLRDRTTGRAQLRVGYADEVISLAQEHEHLEKLGRNRSPEQARRYAPIHRWYLDYRKMDEDAVQAREHGRPEQAERLVNRQNTIGKAVKDRLTERRQKPLELRPIYQP